MWQLRNAAVTFMRESSTESGVTWDSNRVSHQCGLGDKMRDLGRYLVLLSGIAALTACGEAPTEPIIQPTIEVFEANVRAVGPGGKAVLSWRVANGSNITLRASPGGVLLDTVNRPVSSFSTAPLTVDTEFTLVAYGRGGHEALAQVAVQVDPNAGMPPRIQEFAIDKMSLVKGESATIRWRVENVANLSIEDKQGNSVYSGSEASGMVEVRPNVDQTYRLVAQNDWDTVNQQVSIVVLPDDDPTISQFQATPQEVDYGRPTTISWIAFNSDQGIELSQGSDAAKEVLVSNGPTQGQLVVYPRRDLPYVLTARGSTGPDATQMLSVTVRPRAPLVAAFAGVPEQVALGRSAALTWRAEGSDEIRILEDDKVIHTSTASEGVFNVRIENSAQEFELLAVNPHGMTRAMTTVYGHRPAQIDSFTAQPNTYLLGTGTATLAWATRDTARIELHGNGRLLTSFGGATAIDRSGSYVVTATASTLFTLTASSAGGMQQSEAVVYVSQNLVGPENTISERVDSKLREDWFTVDIAEGGYLSASTGRDCGFDTLLSVYTRGGQLLAQSDDAAGQGVCSAVSHLDDSDLFAMPAGTYLIRVESRGGFGSYSLQVQSLAPGCGNGVLEATESCDDGNLMPGDGCDRSCGFEGLVEREGAGNDTPSGPGVVTASAAVSWHTGSLPTSDEDWLSVNVPEGHHLHISSFAGNIGGCAAPGVELSIYQADGTTVLLNDAQGPSNGGAVCGLASPAIHPEVFALSAGNYLIRVRARAGGSLNNYFVRVQVVAPGCGNGLVERSRNEVCDDGNRFTGDGCSSICQYEVQTTVLTGTGGSLGLNLMAANDFAVVQIDVTGGGSSIGAEAIDPAGGCMNVDTALTLMDANYNILGRRTAGGPVMGGLNCAAITVPADSFATNLAAGSYYLLVEGEYETFGQVQLNVTIAPPVCGNGIVENNGAEECDDGNTMPLDGCNAMCTYEVLGEVTLPTTTPTLIPGMIVTGRPERVRLVVTSTTYLDAEVFAPTQMANSCDSRDTYFRVFNTQGDQIAFNDDGGPAACSAIDQTTTGALLDPGTYYLLIEEYGNNAPIPAFEVSVGSFPYKCGNGVIEASNGENCDDGNIFSGDGCSSTCRFEGMVIAETEPNDQTGEANALGSQAGLQLVEGRISPMTDIDRFSIVIPAGATSLTVRTQGELANANTCNGDSVLYLDDVMGMQILTDDDGGFSTCSLISNHTVVPGNTYYIRVESYRNSRTIEPYFLTVTLQ